LHPSGQSILEQSFPESGHLMKALFLEVLLVSALPQLAVLSA
jgi:hypothetical protein